MTRLFVSVPKFSRRRRRLTKSALALALTVCFAGAGSVVAGEEETPRRPGEARTASAFAARLDVHGRSLAPVTGVSGLLQPPRRRSSRDSLKNGAIIGAIAGAVGAGAFTALICHLYQEEGVAGCRSDALRGAAIGAAIGAGAGVAVDAALTRHPGVVVRVRLRF